MWKPGREGGHVGKLLEHVGENSKEKLKYLETEIFKNILVI